MVAGVFRRAVAVQSCPTDTGSVVGSSRQIYVLSRSVMSPPTQGGGGDSVATRTDPSPELLVLQILLLVSPSRLEPTL